MSAPVDVLAAHAPTPCAKDPRTAQFHSKSWSYEFSCPVCGKKRRQNANYLGGRRFVMCDGATIKAGPKLEWDEYQAVGEALKGGAK